MFEPLDQKMEAGVEEEAEQQQIKNKQSQSNPYLKVPPLLNS